MTAAGPPVLFEPNILRGWKSGPKKRANRYRRCLENNDQSENPRSGRKLARSGREGRSEKTLQGLEKTRNRDAIGRAATVGAKGRRPGDGR
jgi:hypothetical protein